jgi:RNA polymerase primary sigma factor
MGPTKSQKYLDIAQKLDARYKDRLGSLDSLGDLYETTLGLKDPLIEGKKDDLMLEYESKKGRLDSMYSSFRALMEKSDLEISIESCNKRLNLEGEPQGVRERSLTKQEYADSYWQGTFAAERGAGEVKKYTPKEGFPLTTGKRLTRLGEEYHALSTVRGEKDYIKREGGKYVDIRTDRQKEVADNIIEEVLPLLYITIEKMRDKGIQMPNKKVLRIPKETYQTDEDLIGEVVSGLLPRLQNYDPSKGAMSTFVMYNTAGIIHRSANEHLGLLRLPAHMVERANKALRESEATEPIEALMDKITRRRKGSSEKTSIPYRGALNIAAGLSHQQAIDISSVTNELVDEENIPSKVYDAIELQEVADMVLSTLTPRQYTILQKRFGIGYPEEKDLEQVGEDFGVTRERIRQVEAKGLRKLRHPKRARKLRVFI